VALGGAEKCGLVRYRDRGQGVTEGGSDGLVVDRTLALGAKPREQSVSARDPALAAAQKTRGRRRGQAVVVDERADDPRLVHGRHRPRRGVGAEHDGFGLDAIADLFDHDSGLRIASLLEVIEPPEAIDDLVAAIALGHDPKRHRGQSKLLLGARAMRGAQSREARAQAAERHLGHDRRTDPGVDGLVARVVWPRAG
jgi:hypothetical protein